MKAEDAERLWCLATAVNGCSLAPLPEQLADLVKFARACEQHGIERSKEHATVTQAGDFDPPLYVVDWSALDAEVAKENET